MKSGLRRFSSAKDPFNNIPQSIWDLTKRKLYKNPQHPISTITEKIGKVF